MATYAIGDIQGCYKTFMQLLETLEFRPSNDTLWLAGDVVNRGPRSVEVLRWLVDHERCVVNVLGNHDLHLIALSMGVDQYKKKDTLEPVLQARDGQKLVEWLQHCPLLVQRKNDVLVHAGWLPLWHLNEALYWSQKLHAQLTSPEAASFLHSVSEEGQATWDANMDEHTKLKQALRIFTNIRVTDPTGAIVDYSYKKTYNEIPASLRPWFQVLPENRKGLRLFFGHWAALGFYQDAQHVSLDTGCVWKNGLTAYCLENDKVTFEYYNEDE